MNLTLETRRLRNKRLWQHADKMVFPKVNAKRQILRTDRLAVYALTERGHTIVMADVGVADGTRSAVLETQHVRDAWATHIPILKIVNAYHATPRVMLSSAMRIAGHVRIERFPTQDTPVVFDAQVTQFRTQTANHVFHARAIKFQTAMANASHARKWHVLVVLLILERHLMNIVAHALKAWFRTATVRNVCDAWETKFRTATCQGARHARETKFRRAMVCRASHARGIKFRTRTIVRAYPARGIKFRTGATRHV